jgi:hypothetical protein
MEVSLLMILKTCLAFSLLTFLHPIEYQKVNSQNPKIISFETNFPKDGGWVRIPKGTKKITFNVKAENTETILFWLIPTGTQTWNQRKLIGYDIKESDKDNNFSLTWIIDRSLLDHLHIQAIGEGVENGILNLYME